MAQVIFVGQESTFMEYVIALTESHEFTAMSVETAEDAMVAIGEDTRLIVTEAELPDQPAHEFAQLVANDPTLPSIPPIMLWDSKRHSKNKLAEKGFSGVVPRQPRLDWFREFIHTQIQE
jgi:CheY-like chemotaxis protein